MRHFTFVFLMLVGVAHAQQPAPRTTPIPPSKTKAESKPETPAITEPEYPLNLEKVGLTLPDTEDQELKRILTSPKTIFYKLPSVWQQFIPASKIEHNNLTLGTKSYSTTQPVWGVYFAPFLSDFNANPLFPWETLRSLHSVNPVVESE